MGDPTQPTRGVDNFFAAPSLRTDQWVKVLAAARAWQNGKDKAAARKDITGLLAQLAPIESFHAYPGSRLLERLKARLESDDAKGFHFLAQRISTAIISRDYKHDPAEWESSEEAVDTPADRLPPALGRRNGHRPYFEVLAVSPILPSRWQHSISESRRLRRPEDDFVFEMVMVGNAEDAICACILNPDIAAVLLYEGFGLRSGHDAPNLRALLKAYGLEQETGEEDLSLRLAGILKRLRPELDIYLLTDRDVERVAGDHRADSVRRVFYQVEEPLELHLSVLEGIRERYETPFFDNLKRYAQRPISTFHALPIARGKAVFKSDWIRDMGEFYGPNLFLAESSATTGGLDSLLEPTGNIKRAQELAARAFGADRVFFVTNGTSTSNKMVVQALMAPGDIAIVDRNCHKSHHYGFVLAGAEPYYVEAFPLTQYSMYGAVPLHAIKKALLELKAAGRLHRVKLLDLTNCTFDGHVYNTRQVMEECLAIKPDLIFLWDEAWFGFARWSPFLRPRTAMGAAANIEHYLAEPAALEAYEKQSRDLGETPSDEQLLNTRLVPDPRKVRLRVYQTNSTHKSMSAIRQGSMVLVKDVDYHTVEEQFHEAVFTHASTSPNQQLIAGLDVARRQMELEGYGLVANATEIALAVRQQVNSHPVISKYFRVLRNDELVPAEFRKSGFEDYLKPGTSWMDAARSVRDDEFFLDPTRMTLVCGRAGFDGTQFKGLLANKYNIQVNKTSRNSVLLQSNINNTRSDIALLIRVLLEVSDDIEKRLQDGGPDEREAFEKRVQSLMHDVPELPNFSRFDERYRTKSGDGTLEGDIRTAFFDAYDAAGCEHIRLASPEIDRRLEEGPDLVSANFVIPYPPGFPIMVPGQVITRETIDFMRKLDVKEIHGYSATHGLKLIRAGTAKGAAKPKGKAHAA
jgi:arginine decarboxylase